MILQHDVGSRYRQKRSKRRKEAKIPGKTMEHPQNEARTESYNHSRAEAPRIARFQPVRGLTPLFFTGPGGVGWGRHLTAERAAVSGASAAAGAS